jgi:hypothetical protein
MTADLSLKDQFHWGLRLQPSFEQAFQSTKKKIQVPAPDRSAKWFALSNYRLFMLEAAKKYNDYEHLKLDYDSLGATLPQRAAMVHAGPEEDPAWERMSHATHTAEEHDAYELAFEAMNAEHRREAAQQRAEYMANLHTLPDGHWFIGANHDDLQEVGVEHETPIARPLLTNLRLQAPVKDPVAVGQLGALQPFPTFEQLNQSQPRVFRQAIERVNPNDVGYEQLRQNALGR